MFTRLQLLHQNNHRQIKLTIPETLVLVVLILTGSFLAFKIPLGAGFDEETHLLRVWEMSAFKWIPNSRLSTDMHFPAFYWDNSYRRQAILEPVDPGFWRNDASTPIDGTGFVHENLTTRSVYSPLLLLPQSLVMFFLGRLLHLPALIVLIAMRLAGLLCYTLLVCLAIRWAPFSKWMWVILVLTPMAIYQASTVTTDTISNGLGFLFVSSCLYLATLPQIRWKEWLTLVFLFLLLFMAKVNLVILALLPFITLPPARFKMKRGFILLGSVAGILALLEVGGWNLIAYSRFYTALPGADPAGQVQYIFAHPFSAAWVVITDFGRHILPYIKGWIADYGYGYWGTPSIIYPIYLVALLATFFISDQVKPDKRTRLGIFIVFGLSFLATQISLYVSYTPVGSTEIQGVHGRYFSVIFPLLLVGLGSLSIKSIKLNHTMLTRITTGTMLVCMLVFSAGMYLSFYTRCGSSFFQKGLCYQPVYKNWAPDTNFFQPITSTHTLTQWIIPKCNYLTSVLVWVDSAGADTNGETEFILTDMENDSVVLDVIQSNPDLPRKGWFELASPADVKSGGKWYTLTIQNPEDDLTSGIHVASSLRAEYIDAPLFQNGVEQENDVIFQYGCIAGWQKLLSDVILLINK
ncbi:MAG: hypothetical protein A2032_05990 [Chloroflexi bacterium RBG_19FT_COMBO_49_13]|nr:MAG: hypothetical protein A2032_05990 [Chloroflexi bacterium RBG_19FT_COMBO_49_13]